MNITTKQIKKFAKTSFTNKDLDIKKVNRITKLLNRSELKIYIKAIKSYQNSKTITLITSKITEKNNLLKQLSKLYPNKNIVIKEDKSLIGGIKIVDNDMIHESNIKNNLENLILFINN